MAVNYANTIKYSGKGYLDEKMNPVANLAALEDKFDAIKELKAGMTVTVLDDGSGIPTDYVYDGSQWIKKVDLSDYAKLGDIPSVPSKTSQLANDSGFVTSAQTQAAINDAVNGIEIPDPADLTGYYTSAQTEAAIASAVEGIEIPDVSGKANATAVTSEIAAAIEAETARTESTYLKTHQPLKTINNQSLVGEGNITIEGGSALEIIEFTGAATGQLTDEQFEKLSGNGCAIKYQNRIYTKAYESDGGIDYRYAGKRLTNDDITCFYVRITKDSKQYTFGEEVDARPKVSGNVEATNATPLTTLRVGLNVYSVPTVPSNVSEFTNDAGYITGYSVTKEDVTNALEFEPLSAVPETYATKQDVNNAVSGKMDTVELATVATSGSYNDLEDKPIIPEVPISNTAFTNDAGYITGYTVSKEDVTNALEYTPLSGVPEEYWTSAQTESAIDAKVAAATGADLSAYYTSAQTDDAIASAINAIEFPETDLTNYYTKDEADSAIAEAVGTIELPSVPSKTSDLENDSNFITNQALNPYWTSAETESAIIEAVAAIDNSAKQDVINFEGDDVEV